MLLGCLEAIISSAKEVEALRNYAIGWWPLHLADADLSMTNPADKITVGKYMMSLFTDEEIMPHWWIMPSILSKYGWLFTDEPIDAVLNWLRDPTVTKSYTDKEKAWVKTLISNTSPDADILEYVAKYLARILLSDSSCNAEAVYSALQAFRTKIKHRKDPSVVRVQKELSEADGVSGKQIKKLFMWAAEINAIDLPETYQANRCLARCLRLYGCYDEALKEYEHTITLSDDNWFAQWGLSNAYEEQEQWQPSIDLLEVVLEKVMNGEAKANNPKQFLQNMRYLLARRYRKLEHYEVALKLYDNILSDTPTDYSVIYAKLQTFAAQQNYQAIIDLLDQLQSAMDPNFGISQVGRLIHTQGWNEDFDPLIIEASNRTSQPSKFVVAYTKAVEDTSVPACLPDFPSVKATWRVLLTYTLADEMWRLARSAEEKNEVVDLWEKLIPDAMDAGQVFIKTDVGKMLVNVYADRLRAYAPDSVEAADLIKKMADLAIEERLIKGRGRVESIQISCWPDGTARLDMMQKL